MPDREKVVLLLKNLAGHIKETERHLGNVRNYANSLIEELGVTPAELGLSLADRPTERAAKRAALSLPVTYKLKGKPMMRKRIDTRDISSGGARMVLFKNDPVNVGEVLELQIFLPDKPEPAPTDAEVTRVFDYEDPTRTGHEIGVKFTTLADPHRAAIERLIRQQGG